MVQVFGLITVLVENSTKGLPIVFEAGGEVLDISVLLEDKKAI